MRFAESSKLVQFSHRFAIRTILNLWTRTSDALLKLKSVTLHYEGALERDKIPQFGLKAEEMENVNPDLVIRGEEGKVMTVHYKAVNAMLLNEFLRAHRKLEEKQAQWTGSRGKSKHLRHAAQESDQLKLNRTDAPAHRRQLRTQVSGRAITAADTL
jgi:hypothetical protein